MLQDIASIAIFVLQLFALVWAAGVFLRIIFGFGLDEDGEVVVKNRRGKFISHQVGRTADTIREFARFLRGKTHDTKIEVLTGPNKGQKAEDQPKS